MTNTTKDFPPKTVTDADATMDELQKEIAADKKEQEEREKAKVEKEADKLAVNLALLDDLRKSGASEETLSAMYKRMGIEEPEKEKEAEADVPPDPDSGGAPLPPVTTLEADTRTPEEKKVDETRNKYIKEYLRNKKIVKARSSILDVFKNKEQREEKYKTNEYKEAKREYDQARADMGNDLFNKKRLELVATGIPDPEIAQKLKEYKAGEILNKTIIDEWNKLAQAKAEGTLTKPAAWKRALNWYVKLPRGYKILLSTSIFMGAGAIAAGGVTVSLLGVAAGRFTRGIASGLISSAGVKGFDSLVYKKKNEEFNADQNTKRMLLREQFGTGTINQEQYEKEMQKLESEDKKRGRIQALAKMGVGIALGAGLGAASSHLGIGTANAGHGSIGHGAGHLGNPNDSTILKQPIVDQDTTLVKNPPTADTTHIPQPKDIPNQNPVTTNPDQTIPTTPGVHKEIFAEVGKGHGAIKTIEELQEKLRAEYPEGSTDVPPSVQHILDTKADRLAIEYGMFKPGEDAESAIMKLGSKFKADKDGNISFTQEGTTTMLEKGTDANVTEAYAGRMIDGDHSGNGHNLADHNQRGADIPGANDIPAEKIPGGTNITTNDALPIPKGDGNLNSLPAEKIPGSVNQDQLGTNLTAARGENISPPQNQFDNSNGTNTYSIRPHEGIYNTGGASTLGTAGVGPSHNVTTEGNGFTTKASLTKTSLEENLNTTKSASTIVATENIGMNDPDVGLESDPRHLEDAADVRHTYHNGVRINKPDTDEINGVDAKNWNNATDQMFEEKDRHFNSYDDYQKEKELQELLGHGEQKVEYVESLGQNAEVVKMDYFRETTEWPIVQKIPAKYFFDGFHDVKLADGTPLPQADFDKLIETGIVKDSVTDTDGVINHEYVFKNHDQLERLQKMYSRLTPKAEEFLNNDKPINDETLEKYIERITHKVYEADDGTLWGFKENVNDNTITRAVNTPAQPVTNGNIYQPSGGNSSVVIPAYGQYPSTSGYDRTLIDRAVNVIKPSWTTPVKMTNR